MKKQKTVIFLPTYKRPDRIKPWITNLLDTTKQEDFSAVLIVEDDDSKSFTVSHELSRKVHEVKYIINKGKSVPSAVNLAYQLTHEPLISVGIGDDCEFHDRWLTEAKKCFEDPEVMVVATADGLSDKGNSSFLLRREYIEKNTGTIDRQGPVFYPYNHLYADTEFWYTALYRNVAVRQPRALVKHKHYTVYGGFERDETSEKNEATARIDRKTYLKRREMFAGPANV